MRRARLIAGAGVLALALVVAILLSLASGGSEPEGVLGGEGLQAGAAPQADSDGPPTAARRDDPGDRGPDQDSAPDVPADQVQRIDPPPPIEEGDDSVETFGDEARPQEVDAIASTLATFFRALATGSWQDACRLASSRIEEGLRSLAERVQPDGEELPDCVAYLEATVGRAPRHQLRRDARVRLGSVRVEGSQAFAIYKGPEGRWMTMPMVREGDQWRVGSLAAVPLR